MNSTTKAFLVSVVLFLFMMWLFSTAYNSPTIANEPISIIVSLVAFGLAFAWVKNEFFSDRDDE